LFKESHFAYESHRVAFQRHFLFFPRPRSYIKPTNDTQYVFDGNSGGIYYFSIIITSNAEIEEKQGVGGASFGLLVHFAHH